jgi:hypothetical protein
MDKRTDHEKRSGQLELLQKREEEFIAITAAVIDGENNGSWF